MSSVSLLKLCDPLVDGLSDVVNVSRGDPAHAHAAVLQQVDVLLLDEELADLGGEAGEGEHADLKMEEP